jgi:prolyl oligopeptidase
MRSAFRSVRFAALFLAATCGAAFAQTWTYPNTPQRPVTDTYFGVPVVDNYRWIEKLDDPTVTTWLKSQADLTAGVVDRIPGRDSLMGDFVRLDALKPATIAQVTRKGGRYFYKKTLPTETVGRLYYREGMNGKETLLFDPTEGAGGKSVSLSFYEVTEDGKKVALGVAAQGSESATIRIMNVDDRTFYPEVITPSWQGIGGWTKDGAGFTYNLLNATDVHDQGRELNTAARYHAVGTDPAKDPAILSAAKYPALGMSAKDIPQVGFSDDFKYVFGSASSVRNELTVFYAPAADLLEPTIAWKPLVKPSDDVVTLIAHGDMVYMRTHKDAPRYRVLAMSLLHPDVASAKEVVPEQPNIITGLSRTRDFLLVTESDGVNAHLYRAAFADGKLSEVALPRQASVLGGGYDATSNDAAVGLASWTHPPERYELDVAASKVALSPLSVAASYPGLDDVVADEVEAKAPDGVMVPLTILHEKSVALDGHANCYLSGYGAYGISRSPNFSIMNLALVQRGIVVAVAHVRGGGEKGFAWYHAGYKATKPNTWNDFIACAEYLVQNKWTSPPKLFGEGTSAGGILIGRAITERPDLFGAAICNVPCANALRMEESPNGPVNTPEFGTVKDSAECRELMEMDAFHHVKDGVKYPAVICVGGFNDPRVIVWQPAKMAAALQHATASGKPVLLQVNYDDGHFTEDKKVTFRNFANMYAFCLWQTGNPRFALSMPN